MNRGPRAGIAVLALVVLLGAASCSKNSETSTDGGANGAPATAANGAVSFPAPKDPGAAIKQANLPELSVEGSVRHDHAHLDVEINGHAVTVPANIGITKTGISPLHTHDTSGILHIEAEADDIIRLGQFFTEWGVTLDKNCIATYCNDDKNQLLGFLNGELVGDPASIPLNAHDQIVIWYGPKSAGNPKLPATTTFPPGL